MVTMGMAAPIAIGAAAPGDVIINEIAWMGSTTSANDEWMELFNATQKDIDLSGWVLKSDDEKINIHLKGFIIAGGFYIMERTDDSTVPSVPADLIYTGALNNAGQSLKLYDALNNLVDQVNFLTKWPAGDNTTKQTMEKTSAAWQSSSQANGTPKAENSGGATEISHSQLPISNQNPNVQTTVAPTVLPSPTPTSTPYVNITYPEGIVINEILPSPEGADETNEWIEIYNSNTVEINLQDWKLQDTKGTPATYIFPKNTVLPANGYLVLKRPDTKMILNNDEDGLNLMWPDGQIIDSMSYQKALKNQSYNKIKNTWQWSIAPTPGAGNTIQTNAPAAAKVLPKAKKTDNKIHAAAVSNPVNSAENPFSDALETTNASNPWPLFAAAAAITIISTAVILFLKLKILKNN